MPLSQCMHPIISARGMSSALRQRGMIPLFVCLHSDTSLFMCAFSWAQCVAPPNCGPLYLFVHFLFLTSLFVNTFPLCSWTQLRTLFRHSFSLRGSVIHSDPTELWPRSLCLWDQLCNLTPPRCGPSLFINTVAPFNLITHYLCLTLLFADAV